MSHTIPQTGPPFRDALAARLRLAVTASLLLNLALWSLAASVARHPPAYDPRPVEITRVIINQQGQKTEKVIKKEQIKRKVEQIRKVIRQPKPPPRPEPNLQPHPLAHVPAPIPTRFAPRPQPPQGAHNRVLVAKMDKSAPPPAPDEPTALPDGNAAPGKVIDQQNPGNAPVNPPVPVAKASETTPTPAPVQQTPAPPPVVKVEPAPQPPPAQPKPEPMPEPVRPKGPTKEAEPVDQVKPEIPDGLKQQGGYKSFVRVKVIVEPDGSATTVLRTSSGNPDIDSRVLEALKQWRWKPALKSGVPVESTQLFKFEFEVE
jgi:periplasmic protein TonB